MRRPPQQPARIDDRRQSLADLTERAATVIPLTVAAASIALVLLAKAVSTGGWVLPTVAAAALSVAAAWGARRLLAMVHDTLVVPLEQVMRVTDDIRAGNFTTRVPDDGHLVEISRLASTVNTLSARMEADQRRLERDASVDELTSLANRRAANDHLAREVARASRSRSPVTICLMDIDHFKHVNDTYGHPVGDEVLVEVAARLTASVRPSDLVCRWGGEEFLVTLADTPIDTGLDVADRIRRTIADTPVDTDAGPLDITLSMGVAVCPSHGTHPKELTELADQALYASKESGRNRVTLHQPGAG